MQYTIKGAIRRIDGGPVANVVVRAYDLDVSRETLLGALPTKPDGTYTITYTETQFRPEKKSADLIVRVYAPDVARQPGRLLATSPTIYNAQQVETVDFTLADRECQGPSEYDKLVARVTPLIGKVALSDVREDDQVRSVTFLVNKTGITPQQMQLLVTAAKLGKQTNLSPEVFYGCLRQGLPGDLPSLLAQSAETLMQSLQAALDNNIIPAQTAEDLKQSLAKLAVLAGQAPAGVLTSPAFLFKPEVLYGSLADSTKFSKEEGEFIAAKLNGRLNREIINAIGPVSPDMSRAIQTVAARVDYRKYPDADLVAVITGSLLSEIKQDHPSLAGEAAALETHLAEHLSARVRDLLGLDAPLKDNPALVSEIRAARTQSYTSLAKLDKAPAKQLADRNLNLQSISEDMLADLVQEGVLTDQQKGDLRLIIELGRLTGDNQRFISSLVQNGAKSTADFIGWDHSGWLDRIKNWQIPLPPGETAETYADNLRLNIERTYPAQVLFSHLLASQATERVGLLDLLNSLLADNDRLIASRRVAPINWDKVDPTTREQMARDLQDLALFANSYRHLGVVELINDKTKKLYQKKDEIMHRVELLDAFRRNNPDLDLRYTQLFGANVGMLNWKDISSTDQILVTRRLMACQRTLVLTDTLAESETLLNHGYDSAATIVSVTRATFMARCGLEQGIARKVYAQAQAAFLSVAQLFETVRDAVRGQYQDLRISNLDPKLINDLQEIDGFDKLFGSQNYCGCEEYKSILSPAAYFVDLMHFIEQHVSNPVFGEGSNHPLYLKNRRGDLWSLPLTHENTYTLVPYLTIVNEVLENYLSSVMQGDIYQDLAAISANTSFSLPFNLPLQALRLYLSHFGIALQEIYRLLKEPDEKVWRARLNLSQEELGVITTPDPGHVGHRFGNPSSLDPFDVPEFIRYAGISRSQLDELLALSYNPDLSNVTIQKQANPDELQNFPEFLAGLTPARADFIHRFIRLWRKTSWSIPELDLVLTALKESKLSGAEITSTGLYYLAWLLDDQGQLGLSVEELPALFYHLPAALLNRLFNAGELFGEDPVTHLPKSSTTFHHYAFNTKDTSDKEVDTKTPILLAGLGVSETELLLLFVLLQDQITFSAEGDCTLDITGVTLLYRYARLARALHLTIAELGQAWHLGDPKDPVITTLEHVDSLCDFVNWLRSSPFTISELCFILDGDESPAVNYKADQAMASAILQQVHDSQETDKFAALKALLAKAYNLNADQLGDVLSWVSTDINNVDLEMPRPIPLSGGQPANPDPSSLLLKLLKEMERVLLVFGNLKFGSDTIAYLTRHRLGLGIANLKALTLDDLKALSSYRRLIAVSEGGELLVQAVLGRLPVPVPPVIPMPPITPVMPVIPSEPKPRPFKFTAADVSRLAELWQVERSLVESLAESLKLPSEPLQAVMYVWECLDMCMALGINGHSLQKLAEDASYDKLSVARDIALGAFSSKYQDEKSRKEKLEPYQDRINVFNRDILCNYIIAQPELKFKDLSDIYAYLLLDVEMSGCYRTSRLVCAISSLQLYVHRILADLERSGSGFVLANEIRADDWASLHAERAWRKNYRLWEANRKVFLYAENYLEADLRADKTNLFKELEDELLQQKITQDSAEAAYRRYVAGLTELAKLRIVGSYYCQKDQNKDLYYFFGRTSARPYQYFYRTYQRTYMPGGHVSEEWGNWVKMELAIEASELSAFLYLGKLYVFWTEVQRRELSKVAAGNQTPLGYEFKVYVRYAFLDEHGKWSTPQRAYVGFIHFQDCEVGVDPTDDDAVRNAKLEHFQEVVFRRPYPIRTDDTATPIWLYYIWPARNSMQVPKDQMDVYRTDSFDQQVVVKTKTWNAQDAAWDFVVSTCQASLDVYEFQVKNGQFPVHRNVSYKLDGKDQNGTLTLEDTQHATMELPLGDPPARISVCVTNTHSSTPNSSNTPVALVSKLKLSLATNSIPTVSLQDLMNNLPDIGSSEVSFLQKEYLEVNLPGLQDSYVQDGTRNFTDIYRIVWQELSRPHLSELQIILPGQETYIPLAPRVLIDEFSQRIFAETLDEFLSLATQCMADSELRRLDFSGPYGIYYRELFFHIPFLVADHLNAEQKFEEARWWYERIFNPTADEAPGDVQPAQRNWRYSQFRNLTIEKMKDLLTNYSAIEAYKKDSFDPHAIAALRLCAYPKAIVMKYIDNLLDWGDSLFAQDTVESINEATLLYVLAADLLGKRPAVLGTCETACNESRTYEKIGPAIGEVSEFLISLENWSWISIFAPTTFGYAIAKAYAGSEKSTHISGVEPVIVGTPESSTSRMAVVYVPPKHQVDLYSDVVGIREQYIESAQNWRVVDSGYGLASTDITGQITLEDSSQSGLVFCVPPNDELLKYWDRVEDRLFKIHCCMNISGVRRQLALFQPPIEPMLLVKAKAAGLSLEEIIAVLAAPPPLYRFSYLIEKARQFTQTVQTFGAALLGALEKKDAEELTLLRSVHERNILEMTKKVKQQQLQDAQYQYQALVETKTNVQSRIDYYASLVKDGLTGWEVTQQVSRHIGTGLRLAESVVHLQAALTYLVPQVGSPFAMKYGGQELGDSGVEFAAWTASMASIADAISTSASLEASFQRRAQEWKQQLLLAQQELKQVEQQRLAADIRQLIAQQDLDIHEKNMEQADELDDFYKNKFTNLGLYNYLATALNRLYREAYNVAYDLARLAEKAYQIERDDDTSFFILPDTWQYERAGLLAGERLLLQLQQMEMAHLTNNSRDLEVTQSFSLTLLSPSDLVSLRQTGSCTFTIPEFVFDLYYPGQYNRRIKSVRLTIPCVVGPYTNVGATLTLTKGIVRPNPDRDDKYLKDATPTYSKPVATSNAQNDGGLFELNFRDERYLPFEGAGAISTWTLELPDKLRTFNYDTISDVILHISYTAKYDSEFRKAVEGQIANMLSNFAEAPGLWRLLSLKHEFPSAFRQLLNPSGTAQITEFDLTRQHFPYFLSDKDLALSEVKVYLKPKDKDRVTTNDLTFSVNLVDDSGNSVTGTISYNNWSDFAETLKEGSVSLSCDPCTTWKISAEGSGLDSDKLDDILILLKYTAP